MRNWQSLCKLLADAAFDSTDIYEILRHDDIKPVIAKNGRGFYKSKPLKDPDYGKRWEMEMIFQGLRKYQPCKKQVRRHCKGGNLCAFMPYCIHDKVYAAAFRFEEVIICKCQYPILFIISNSPLTKPLVISSTPSNAYFIILFISTISLRSELFFSLLLLITTSHGSFIGLPD